MTHTNILREREDTFLVIAEEAIKEKIKSFHRASFLAALEGVREKAKKKRENLVVDNWENGEPKCCNPRCHDSGKESALTDLITYLENEIAEIKNSNKQS